MAQSLTAQDIKLLDQTRQRLSQLTDSLTELERSIVVSNPLPPYSSLQNQTRILGQTLTSIASHLQSDSLSAASAATAAAVTASSTTTSPSVLAVTNNIGNSHASSTATQSGSSPGLSLAATSVYPLPVYPGRETEKELLLSQLLRKKADPGVEQWVEEGREEGAKILGNVDGMDYENQAKEWRELWEWAGVEANGVAREYDWGGDLEEDDEEGNEDDEDENQNEDGSGKGEGRDSAEAKIKNGPGSVKESVIIADDATPMPLEDVMRFITRGEVKG